MARMGTSAPRRVLFLTQTHNVWGGMEQWLHNFTFWLQNNGHWEVRVGLARGRRFNDPDRYLRAHPHITPMIIDARVGTPSARVSGIVRAIEDFDPDIIVPIATGAVFDAVSLAKANGSRVRFLQPNRALVPELMANVLDRWEIVDGVVSISRLFHRFFQEELPAERDRLHYVRHGVRPPAVAGHDRSRLEHAALPLRVGFVGRIEPEMKRIFDLPPLIEALSSSGANVEIHLFGSGPAEGELRARLAEIKVPVTFHGYKSQQALYAEAYPVLDVVLLFSGAGEGTPNAICEAMQHGVVPVISRYPGQAGERFVIHERNGFTFPVGDVAAAAAHVKRLAGDRRLLERMSEQARHDVESDTDVRMHGDWLAIFDKTMALPQKRPQARRTAPGSGRLNRVLSPAVADRVRGLFGRHFLHPDGWSEWPGSEAAAPERITSIEEHLRRIDEDEQRRAYGRAS